MRFISVMVREAAITPSRQAHLLPRAVSKPIFPICICIRPKRGGVDRQAGGSVALRRFLIGEETLTVSN